MKINKLFLNILVMPVIFGMEPENHGQKRKFEEIKEFGDSFELTGCNNAFNITELGDILFEGLGSNFEKFDALPDNMKEEVVKQYIISLIQEYISSNKSNKLQMLFKQVGNLARANKLINSFVLKYMQGIDTISGQLKAPKRDIVGLECFELEYDLLKCAAYKNWSGFWNLILDNLDVINIAKEELQEALLCFAVIKMMSW